MFQLKISSCSKHFVGLRSKESVGLGSKERPKNRAFRVCPCENRGRDKIRKWGMEQKETLADKPLGFENLIRQQTGLVIGWTSQVLLICVDHRS